MSKGTVNKVILIGRLGQDPEVRYAPSGAAVANFSIATNRGWKNKDGENQEETTWHRIVAWSRLAEFVKEYVKKGNRIYVEGRLQNRSWEDQNGQKRYMTEVVAANIQLLESAGSRGDFSTPPAEENLTPPSDLDTPDEDVPF